MPDAAGPLVSSVKIASGAGKELTDSREAIKQMRDEIREAVRDLDRLWQGVQNKTIGGAGGWQMSFDALHSAQDKLNATMQQQEERARKDPKPPPSDPTYFDRIAKMYQGRFSAQGLSRTVGQAFTGQWTAEGEAVAAGYNALQIASSLSPIVAGTVAIGAAIVHQMTSVNESVQLKAEIQNQRASELLSLHAEDRVTGKYGAPFLSWMSKKREATFQEEYNERIGRGGVFTRAKASIMEFFGGVTAEAKAAEAAARQETERQANLAIYGERYKQMTDVDAMESDSLEVLEQRGRRATNLSSFWGRMSWLAESVAAIGTGGKPFAARRHDQAVKLQQERMAMFTHQRDMETYLKTEEEAKGIGYRTANKNRNIYMFAMEERLYKSDLQWNSF